MNTPKQSIKVLSTLALAASDAREDTLLSIIVNTIYEKDVKQEGLVDEIRALYHFEPHKIEVEALFKKLVADGIIVCERDGKCKLSDDERKRLHDLDQELRDQDAKRFQNFKTFITDTLEQNIDVTKIKLLYTVFIEYLYHSFYEFGEEAVQNFVPAPDRSHLDNEDFIQAAFDKLNDGDGSLRKLFKLAIDTFPDHVSREDLSFLNDISLKTQSFVSLGITPEQAEELKEINVVDWTLYLDTNIIYSLLDLHAHPENQSCKALIKLINDNKEIIKIKLRYCDLTLKELTNKKKDFNLLDDKLSDSAINAMLRTEKLDLFTRQFYQSILTNRKNTLHPTKVIDLSNITLKSDEIEISQTAQMIERLGENFLDARTQDYLKFIQDKNDFRLEYAKEKHVTLNPYFRSDMQAYHDITLRELILQYRHRGLKSTDHLTLNNVKYFAITLDDLLIQFDQFARRNFTDDRKFPVFFKPAFLLSKLVKLLPIKTDDYKKAYFKAVTSRGFNKDIRKSDDIQKIVSYLRNKGIDDDKLIYDLISQDLFLEKYRESSKNKDFDNEIFIEDEVNKQYRLKQEELEKNKTELDRIKTVALATSDENGALSGKVAELTQQVEVFSKATKNLTKKISKLENKDISQRNNQFGINFEAEEKDEEIARLKAVLEKKENAERKLKRQLYVDKKLKNWQWRSLIPLAISCVFIFIILIINHWNLDFISSYINSETKDHIRFVASMLAALVTVMLNVFVCTHIYSRVFNESNKKAYCDRLKIPEDLQD